MPMTPEQLITRKDAVRANGIHLYSFFLEWIGPDQMKAVDIPKLLIATMMLPAMALETLVVIGGKKVLRKFRSKNTPKTE